MHPRSLIALTVIAIAIFGFALWELLATPEATPPMTFSVPDPVEADTDGEPDGAPEPRSRVRRRREDTISSLMAKAIDGPAKETNEVSPAPNMREGAAEPVTLDEARTSFAKLMDDLAQLRKQLRAERKFLTQKQWEQHYREANDAYAALSAHLEGKDPDQLAELEDAHVLLNKRLGKLRVRGKKHRAP